MSNTEVDARSAPSLAGATYLPLLTYGRTERAKAFTKELAELLILNEISTIKAGKRRKRSAIEKEHFHAATEALIADLLSCVSRTSEIWPTNQEDIPWGYRSIARTEFSGADTPSWRTFNAVWRNMLAQGFVEYKPGLRLFTDYGETRHHFGKSARFRATPKLLWHADRHGLKPKDHLRNFGRHLPTQVLVLRVSKERGNPNSGIRKPLPKSSELETAADRVRTINSFLSTTEIEGIDPIYYTRIFNGSMIRGGRLYARGSSYQQMPKEERCKIRLNGEPVVEIDIKACQLSLLYGQMGETLPYEDLYEIPSVSRDTAKMWIVASLGWGKPISRWPRDSAHRVHDPQRPRAKTVGSAVLEKHPVLTRWFKTGKTSLDLQFVESEVIIETMLRLIRYEVPSLSMHDGLIVPRSARDTAKETLLTSFAEIGGGGQPLITVFPTEQWGTTINGRIEF